MDKINCKRVILGGLLAGVVLNIIAFILMAIVSTQTAAAREALGKPAELCGGAIAALIVARFAIGIFAVWLYAAIRPRYGAGPKTALGAGFALWLLILLGNAGTIVAGLYPTGLVVIVVLVGLVNMLVATLLGAWIYKEETAPAAA